MNAVILKNGLAYDPLTKKYEKQDIGILGKQIVSPNLIAETAVEIDINGCLVTPGLIDYHVHIYSGCDGAVKADIMTFPNGVTTAVDGGTCGVSNYEMFQKTDIQQSVTRIKSYLNVSSTGLATSAYTENIEPRYFDRGKIKDLFRQYPDNLVALKLRISRNIVEPFGLTREPLLAALEIAEAVGRPLVVHMTDPVIPAEEAASLLRSGDVFCHMYYGQGDTIVGTDHQVKAAIRKARERGVIFDACNGKNNFEFKTAIPAMKEGFFPDIISTDLSPVTQYLHPVISLPWLMSKFMAMGMTLQQVLDATILAPARQLGMDAELATLAAQTTADLAVFRVMEKDAEFFDLRGESIHGGTVIVPQMTIKDGVIVYRQTDF